MCKCIFLVIPEVPHQFQASKLILINEIKFIQKAIYKPRLPLSSNCTEEFKNSYIKMIEWGLWEYLACSEKDVNIYRSN